MNTNIQQRHDLAHARTFRQQQRAALEARVLHLAADAECEGLRAIARAVGVSEQAVGRILRRHGVRLRRVAT